MSISSSNLDGRQVIYDVGSGEAVGQVVALDDPLTPRKRRPLNKRFSTPYLTVFMPALDRVAADPELRLVDIRVWLAILARATHEKPEWDTDSAGIGRQIGLHPKNVLKSIRRLQDKGLILRPRYGKLALPPDVAWRGSAASRERSLKGAPDHD